MKIKIAFICIGNSCRSQIAEGFARQMGKELLERIDDATGMMFGMYLSWLNAVAGEARIDAKSLNSQTFISATCGYGSNRWPSLRDFSYALARRVADEAKSL